MSRIARASGMRNGSSATVASGSSQSNPAPSQVAERTRNVTAIIVRCRSWLALGLIVTLGALAMLSLGFVIGSFARNAEVAASLTFLISFPMMFLGGSYFPTESAPAFLAPIIRILPLSYLNDALRQVINNGADLAALRTDALALAVWMVAALLLSFRAFRWE